MRIRLLILSTILPWSLAHPSWADEDALRQRILSHLRAGASEVEFRLPHEETTTGFGSGTDHFPALRLQPLSPTPFGSEPPLSSQCIGTGDDVPDYLQRRCSNTLGARSRYGSYRRLVGEELYPRLVDAVVYLVSEGGVTGAGTVISASFGLIVTNWHVVGSDKVVGLVFKPKGSTRVFSFDENDIFFARVLATDSIRDLAILEIVSRPEKLIAVPLGSTAKLAPGHEVFSVSHPRGSLWRYSEGTISQINPTHEWVRGLGMIHRASTIQTHTTGRNGSSGDPLFDEDGQFIGVQVGGSVTEPNFAISIDEIRQFVFSFLR